MRVGQGAEAQRNFAATALRLIGGRQPLLAAVFYSAGVNVLALTGPAYMLLVYDSVLPSHAGAHLLWLTLLMLLLYGLSARWALAASLDPTSARACRSWLMLNARLRDAQDAAARPTIVSSALLRAMRPALQSATLGLGAHLVLTGACHSAEMLAVSIMLTRALVPLETSMAQWRCLAAARDSAAQLYALLSTSPEPAQEKPKPRASSATSAAYKSSCGPEMPMRVALWVPASDRHRAFGRPPSSGSRHHAPSPQRTRCAGRRARRRASSPSRP
jgi:ABC-type protease/lipase transport system fused ATPase/permease subunit